MGSFISVDKWNESKLSGPRLVKIMENNGPVCANVKQILCISDDQLKLICEYLKSHSPKATIQEGVVVPT